MRRTKFKAHGNVLIVISILSLAILAVRQRSMKMEVVKAGRVDLTPLLTHTVTLDEISKGYEIFGKRLDGVLKVAVKPLNLRYE